MITKSEVKYIQSLGHKKFRNELKQFVAEGPKIVIELLNSPGILLKTIYATADWWRSNRNIYDAVGMDRAYDVEDHELRKISFLTEPNQVLAVFHQPVPAINRSYAGRVSLMLDGIRDPGNMGTIIRIADWFGVSDIVASEDCADVFNPKVVQATMGSIARVHIVYEDLTDVALQQKIPLYVTLLDGEPVHQLGKIKEGFLLVGNESKGVSEQLVKMATHKVNIPRIGHAESLNAAVATGIALSHLI